MTNESEHPDPRGAPDPEPGIPASPTTEDISTPPPPAPEQPEARKRLTRSKQDEWIGGVAGGLAEYFDVDPTLVRIAFVIVAILSSGFAVVGYIVAWIVVPEADEGGDATARRSRGDMGGILWGGILVIAGTLFLLTQLDLDIDLPPWEVGLAAALILVGVLMLVEARHGFNAGLMTMAVILTVLLGISSVSNFNFAVDGAFGNSDHVITQADNLESGYSHIFGSLSLDLSDLELDPGTTEVGITVVFGNAVVDLPDDIPYRIQADSAFGNVEAGSFETRGVANSRTFTSPGYDEAERRLDIDMSVLFGQGRIR